MKASAAIVNAMAAGELSANEAAELSKVVENFAKTLQIYDHERRLRRLEAERSNASAI